MERIILASASPRRKELLSQVGMEYEIIISNIEEKVTSSIPEDVVEELSRQKAEDVFGKIPGDVIVIGADTVVSVDGKILGKPADEKEAFCMIQSLSGRCHSVFTGVTLCIRKDGQEEKITFSEETKVFVDEMTQEDIEHYIATGESMDKAGAYGIQGKFAAFVNGIEGDYNNVVGLPVGRICRELRKLNRRKM
ncbi:MAG: Maf family protein [Thermoflexaceae bacterium]|nr:Maf family protein [Thermoflexaceae bacterium]